MYGSQVCYFFSPDFKYRRYVYAMICKDGLKISDNICKITYTYSSKQKKMSTGKLNIVDR